MKYPLTRLLTRLRPLLLLMCMLIIWGTAVDSDVTAASQSLAWLDGSSLHDKRAYDGAVMAKTRIVFADSTPSLQDQGVWLVGFGTEPELNMPPTALSLVWAQTPSLLGKLWTISLQSDAGLLPRHMSPQAGTGLLSGTEAARLHIMVPQWGHEYEAILGYSPDTGAATVQIMDLTEGKVILSRNLNLNSIDQYLYPAAGVGCEACDRVASAEQAMARVLSLEVIDALLPAHTDWKVMQRRDGAPGFATVNEVDRRWETAVLVNLPWELPGTVRVAIRQAGTTAAMFPIEPGTFSPVSVDHLPAGLYEWVLEYAEGERSWTMDSQHIAIGRLTVEFADVQVRPVNRHRFDISGTLRVTTDGPIETSNLTVQGTLTGYEFQLGPNAADGRLSKLSLDHNVQIGSFTVPARTEPAVHEIPFSNTVATPADGSAVRTIWELILHPELTQGAAAVVHTPQTAWYAPGASEASPGGFLANDTVHTVPLAPGITLSSIKGFSAHGPVEMHLVTADLTHPGVSIGGLVASDFIASDSVQWALSTVTQMASRTGAIAATNANFFEIKETRNPRGMHLSSGQLLKSHNDGWNRSVGFAADGTPYFGFWHWHGIIRPADAPTNVRATVGLNVTTASYDDIVVFRAPWRRSPGYVATQHGGMTVTELVVTGLSEGDYEGPNIGGEPGNARIIRGTITEVRVGEPGVPITDDLLVVTGYGSAGEYLKQTYSQGDKIEVLYAIAGETYWPGLDDWRDLETAVSGNVVILRNGQYGDAAVRNNHELMPRTVVATTQDQTILYLLVVDGRSHLSVGMTYKELADFLLYMGAFHALNLDGGGSSELVMRDPETQRITVVNRPSDGVERPVPDGLAVYYTE